MNTQSKHTPGPTCTCGVITTVIETGIGCYDENEIAQCPLCKAAPAMYEALQIMVRAANVDEIDPLVMFASIERAKSALAQAEGHQHG